MERLELISRKKKRKKKKKRNREKVTEMEDR